MSAPCICFGQQPCGFFPRRFLVAKLRTARRLRSELGGEIVFFFHDSDHDPRETQTILRDRRTGDAVRLNFAFANKVQRKWSPLYLKRIEPGWRERMARQLHAYVEPRWVEAFRDTDGTNVADFCLEMYRRMGLTEGVRIVRSSDPSVRKAACPVEDFFVDLPYQGEVVRARRMGDSLRLHEGGDAYLTLPPAPFGPEQVSPARDTRLKWMQSVLGCTHYVAGAGEQAYLRREDAPEITFVNRDPIDRSDEAYADPSLYSPPLLAFGAHPDDIEFGCGGVVALEARAGRPVHFVVCSRGEAGSDGTPEKREAEAVRAAGILGATIEFIELDGDARLEMRASHAVALAGIVRRLRPGIVLAPTLAENQHPDHARLGRLVRDAARLARYGGLQELRELEPHQTGQLFYYAVVPGAEPAGVEPILIDVSDPEIGEAWTAAMEAHASQTGARPYVELQLARARVHGLRAGVGHAIALYPNDPLLFDSLADLPRSARRF